MPVLFVNVQVVEALNAQRGEKLNRVKIVEKERASLETAKFEAEALLSECVCAACVCIVLFFS